MPNVAPIACGCPKLGAAPTVGGMAVDHGSGRLRIAVIGWAISVFRPRSESENLDVLGPPRTVDPADCRTQTVSTMPRVRESRPSSVPCQDDSYFQDRLPNSGDGTLPVLRRVLWVPGARWLGGTAAS